MESSEFNALPIILVSAKDHDVAKTLISTIIDNEPEMCTNDTSDSLSKQVWRLVNKYYNADVKFKILPDGEKLDSHLEDHIEGHLIYLTEIEALDNRAIEVMERRMRVGNDADVRVIVVDSELEDSTLGASAALRNYELIPIHAPADPEAGDPAGLERVRAAFHAHVWANIRTHNQHPPLSNDENEEDSDQDSWSSWQGAEERREGETDEQFMQRTEAFAMALGSLPEAVAEVRRANGNRTMRIARAELVLSAFCEALGEPFDWPLEVDREL